MARIPIPWKLTILLVFAGGVLLDRPNADINAVAIPTPHERHAEQALLTVGHGKHVYIEKPMDCRRISTDCRFDDHLSGGALGRLTHQDKLREAGLAQCNPPLSSNFNQTSIRGLDDLRRL
jgi:hypothetical protein